LQRNGVHHSEPQSAELLMAKADEFGAPVEIEAAGRIVPITNPNKPMFPSVGPKKVQRTKLDLARYYVSVGDAIMRTLDSTTRTSSR
jgi:hypothetical protein